jgi:hypothetical protein
LVAGKKLMATGYAILSLELVATGPKRRIVGL